MLRIDDIPYSIAGRPLFEGASAIIPTGHKVGLVGRNGTGKTTLFRLIRGELALEGGAITLPQGARIGGVAQEVPASDASLIDTVLAADTERAALLAEAETATDPHPHRRGADPAGRYRRLVRRGPRGVDPQGPRLRRGRAGEPCSAFSGGWRMRVALAGVLFAQPDLLLLDEPTNYLDLEGALWLESYLARYPHTVIVIATTAAC